jgi:hypothetical protein
MAILTLRQLQYLDALARHGHFGRAAEECAVTQPALSMQIRELEMSLGPSSSSASRGQPPSPRSAAKRRAAQLAS